MVLIIAGGGLGPKIDSLRVIHLIKKADIVYVDTYTSPNSRWLFEEARKVGGDLKVIEAPRMLLEDEVQRIIKEASEKNVLVLVPGDPLIATTHVSILLEASKNKIKWIVIPGVSGVTASMTASGLQFYKFGRSITVPGPWRTLKAYSVIEYLYCNLEKGLHTLLLLDYVEGRMLQPWEAAKAILRLENELSMEEAFYPILERLIVIIVERAGFEDQKVLWTRLRRLALSNHESSPPTSLIIPGRIHPTEAEVINELLSIPMSAIDEHNRIVRSIMNTRCFPRKLERPF